jgi:hypothetical protein
MKTMTQMALLVGAALCVAPTFLAQPQFKGMGKIATYPNSLIILCMSDTGEVFGWASNGVVAAVGWSPSTGYFFLPPSPNVSAGVTACTPDGSKVYGGIATVNGNVPVVWTNRTSLPTPIPGHPDPKLIGIGIYATNIDGTILAGTTHTYKTNKLGMFIWRAGVRKNMGWEFITQFPPGMDYGGLNDLNDDGTIGFGGSVWSDGSYQGIRWSKVQGIQALGDLPGGTLNSSLWACSDDGQLAVGHTVQLLNIYNASVWTPLNSWVSCGLLKPEHSGSGFIDVDHSGRVAVGTSDFVVPIVDRTGILWNARDGMRSVKDVLVNDYGLTEAAAWNLTDVIAISPNGRYLAGGGLNPQGKGERWWAEIRPFCYADCDNATSPKGKNAGPPKLDIDDFICFQTKFAIGDYLSADCDLNGYLEIDDFICFQTKFSLVCP